MLDALLWFNVLVVLVVNWKCLSLGAWYWPQLPIAILSRLVSVTASEHTPTIVNVFPFLANLVVLWLIWLYVIRPRQKGQVRVRDVRAQA